MKKQLLITVLAATLLGGCVASGPSVGDYAIGDDSAAMTGLTISENTTKSSGFSVFRKKCAETGLKTVLKT